MFEAHAATICADAHTPVTAAATADMTLELILAADAAPTPTPRPADPEAGWATANPCQALLFLYVSPRPCAAFDELMALQGR